MKTSIYVIGPDGGPYKVGIARRPKRRIAELQTGNPCPLVLHYQTAVAASLARQVEQLTHRFLKPRQLTGEWFDVTLEQATGAVGQALRDCERAADPLGLTAKAAFVNAAYGFTGPD